MSKLDAYKPRGYHRLANIMKDDRDIAIFHRFDDMNMLSLLSLQAEIFELRRDFQLQCSEDDLSSNPTQQDYARYFHALRNSKDHDGNQLELLVRLRSKMKEYNQLLNESFQIAQFESPGKGQFSKLGDWLDDPKGGNCFQKGSEARIYQDPDRSNYVVLRPSKGDDDTFTRFIVYLIIAAFHRLWGERHRVGRVIDEESQLTSYRDSKVQIISAFIATVFSSILPVVTIYVLYSVKDTVKRICITIFFTASFAALLAIFSSARRVDIFAATATFAAVEVVFIGSAIM